MIEIIEHTADIRLRITASTREDLFREAIRGTIALLQPQKGERKVQREVHVEASDPTALLVDFLNEVLSNAHARREAYDDAAISSLTDYRVEARLLGSEVVAFGAEVKAVTYHEADIRRDPREQWYTILVYDI
ncbi:MAG TPA: archease [Thermoanaerobaculia bacterium]|nr:archease [Thermoanaerobaculia bacterium]